MADIAQFFSSSELRDIGLRNDTFEKQIGILELKIEDILRYSKLSKQSIAYLCKLQDDTCKKSVRSKQEMESVTSSLNSSMESSMIEVKSSLRNIEKLMNRDEIELKNVKFRNLRKIIDFPYERAMMKMNQQIVDCKEDSGEKTNYQEKIKLDIEVLKKARDVKVREIQRSQSDFSELEVLVLSKTEDLGKQMTDKKLAQEQAIQEILEKLKDVEASNQNMKEGNQTFKKKLIEVESQLVSVNQLSEQKTAAIEEIKSSRKEVESMNEISTGRSNFFLDSNELNQLFEECVTFKNSYEECTKNDTEVEQLRKELRVFQENNNQLTEELQNVVTVQTRDEKLRSDFNIRNFEVRHLQAELDDYKNKIAKYKIAQQKGLKTPPMKHNPIDFQTPDFVIRRKSANLATSGFDSGFQHAYNNISAYPGIQRISTSLKRKLEMESTGQDADSFQSSVDSSLLTSESGTTADGSLLGGMFSPLRNNVVPVTPPSPEKFEEFSMMDHFKQYTREKSQGKKKKSATYRAMEKRFGSNMFLNSPETDGLTSTSSNDSMMVSSLIVEDRPEEDLEIDVNEDNSLVANESDLDQSVWGSDF